MCWYINFFARGGVKTMNLISKLWRKTKKSVLTAAALVVVASAGVFAYGSYTDQLQAAGCPTNDIMPCGANNKSDFIKKLKANKPSDMNNIYADGRYDLPTSQYDEFAKYAKAGKINPSNGNITVDGVTVGYDAQSIGRNAKSVSHPIKIDGKTYHESPIRLLTEHYNDAMVLFDDKGNVQTVIMNLCGNPMTVKEKNPKYNCDALKMTAVDRDTFKFSSDISASNGATVTKVVYDFGDGTTKTEVSPSTVVEHTYATPGNYTAKVTAYVKTKFGRSEFPITVTAGCQKQLTVEAPKTPHIKIEKFVNTDKKHDQVAVNENYNYTVRVTNDGQVDLTNAVVTDTPKAGSNIQLTSANGVGTITGNVWTHTIPSLKVGQSLTFTLTAKVTAYIAGNLQNDVCVDAPQVPGNPDDCDDATVEVPTPAAACVSQTVSYISRTEVKLTGTASAQNGATVSSYVFTVKNSAGAVVKTITVPSAQLSAVTEQFALEPGDYTSSLVVKTSLGDKTAPACDKPIKIAPPEMVTVCNPATGEIITVPKSEEGNYKPVGDKACEEDVQVCNPATGQVITVKESEAANYKPVGDKACEKDVQVCNPATGLIITVKESDASKYKPVGDKACEDNVEVCNPATGETITVKKSEVGNYKPVNDAACEEEEDTPEVLPSTGPVDALLQLVGATSLAGTAAAYIRSRRA